MKVELLVTLKGKDIWEKGLILDSEQAPIPSDILKEIELKTGAVGVIKPEQELVEEPDKPVEQELEEPVVVEEEPIPEELKQEPVVEEEAIPDKSEPEEVEQETELETEPDPAEQSPSIFQVEPDHQPEPDVSEDVVPEKATTTAGTTEEKCTMCGKVFSSEEYPNPKRSLRGHQARAHHKKSRRK